jgi:RNA polymerase sigma-70 factor (ECF subfamily)
VQEETDADLLSETISAYLDTLDDDPRNIFVRRYWFFESVSEISRRYGFSESKVKSALHRTREGLRKYLENHLLQKWDELLGFIQWFGSLALIKIPIS